MFSMFSSKKETPKPIITIEDTEKFLKEQMSLIAEAKSVDPESYPLKHKGTGTTEENMRAIANEIKWALESNQKRLGYGPELTITDKNKKPAANAIVCETFKQGKSLAFLALLLMMTYRSYNTAPNDDTKNEFIHHLATSLHQVTKDWVNKNGGWVETYVDAAEEQAVKNFVEANRENARFFAKVVKVCAVVGVGLFAISRLAQSGDLSPETYNTLKM